MQYQPVDPIAETRRQYLSRETKPPDWEPVTEEELAEFREKVRQAAMAKQIPEYREMTEQAAAERNGKSEVPTDPVDRKSWARKKAAEMGWLE